MIGLDKLLRVALRSTSGGALTIGTPAARVLANSFGAQRSEIGEERTALEAGIGGVGERATRHDPCAIELGPDADDLGTALR